MFRPDFTAARDNILVDSWHITLNSNKAAHTKEIALEIRNELKEALIKIFEVFPRYLHAYLSRKYGGNRFDYPINQSAEDLIIPGTVKVVPRFEIGTYTHRIHSHTLIQFETEDKYIYQVDINGLRQWIKDNIGPLYINVRHIPNSVKNVHEYIFKDLNK